MHFHFFWPPPLPVISLMLISPIACSQLGHLIMSVLLEVIDGGVGASIVAQGRAGTQFVEAQHA